MTRLADVDIAPYEGLIFSTARRYHDLLDIDLEDVQQILRLKVAQALVVFDPSKWRKHTDDDEAKRRYVFGCVRNQVKDLLKGQDRRNSARGGGQLYVEELREQGDSFEHRYLVETDERALADVLDQMPELPFTLSQLERSVVALLLLDYNQTEIARELGTSRTKVRVAHASVKSKMAELDWTPDVDEDEEEDEEEERRQLLAA